MSKEESFNLLEVLFRTGPVKRTIVGKDNKYYKACKIIKVLVDNKAVTPYGIILFKL